MKKRIFAILTAVIFVLSAFVLASCDDEINENSSQAESEKELTARELFVASLFKTAMNIEYNDSTISQLTDIFNGKNAKDVVGNYSFNINKLEADGNDLASFGKIGLIGDYKFDAANQISTLDYELTFMNETIDASLLRDNKNQKIFITDLFDSFEKPVLLTNGSFGTGIFDTGNLSIDIELIKTNIFESWINSVTTNITDNCFTSQTSNVTIDGKSFENATVITLVVNKETSKKILDDFKKAIKANEKLNELFDNDSFIENDEIPESIKVVNTIVDKKSIALDIEIILPESEANEESEPDDDDYEEDDKTPDYNKIVAKANYVDGNFNFVLGPANDEGIFFDEHGYLEISYKLENENEIFVFGGVEDGKKQELIKLEGTNKNGERKGKLSFYFNGDTLNIDYSLKTTDKNGNIEIGPISIGPISTTSQNETTEIDFKLTANYNVTETKIDVNGNIKFSFENEFKLDADYSVITEYKDVTIDPITDYIEVDDFDESIVETAFKEKCPNLYAMLNGSDEELVPYFIDDEFALYLPEGFEEQSVTGYTAVFDSAEVAVFVLEEEFDDLGADLTLDEYLNLIRNNANGSVSEIFYYPLPYFVYENSEFGMHYIVTAYEGGDSFWLVRFCCSEDKFNYYQERFLEWAYDSGVVYIEVKDDSF